jgi:hypothetical protein
LESLTAALNLPCFAWVPTEAVVAYVLSVVFDRMRIAGHLDQASHVEFKNLVLAFGGLDGLSQTRQGRTLVNAQFSIVGNRRD